MQDGTLQWIPWLIFAGVGWCLAALFALKWAWERTAAGWERAQRKTVQELLAVELDARRQERRREIAERLDVPEAMESREVETLQENVRAMGNAMPSALQAERAITDLQRARRERLADAASVNQDQEGGAR
jgi:hypothetical protein